MTFSVSVIARTPAPVFYVELPEDRPELLRKDGFDDFRLLGAVESEFALTRGTLLSSTFRAVPLDRLTAVFQNGIDVEPPHAPFFAGDFSKAWEYGGVPKVVMALDIYLLESSFEAVSDDAPSSELAALGDKFPTRIDQPERKKIWFTKFPATDTRAGSPYERAYGRWIPSCAKDALKGVLVFGRPSDGVFERVDRLLAPVRQ